MRDQLLGYLLGALDAPEHGQVEEALQSDPQLRSEADLLRRSLEPLEVDREHHQPPLGLALNTCRFVAEKIAPAPPVSEERSAGSPRRWALIDLAVAAGVLIAAGALFFPAVHYSQAMAHRTACEHNLYQNYGGLQRISDESPEHSFPAIPVDKPYGVAGVYAAILKQHGLLDDDRQLLCPGGASQQKRDAFRVPTLNELASIPVAQLGPVLQELGGSYGYGLGYLENGRYVPMRNDHRPAFAIMADAPDPQCPERRSNNHGRCGQNVLFADGHVEFVSDCTTGQDDIFFNRNRQIGPGVDRNDAVIGASDTRPLQ